MTVKSDEEEGWFLIGDFKKEELEDKEITFKANDLREWFGDFDKWWLSIRCSEVCISYEGVTYEPHFYGKVNK